MKNTESAQNTLVHYMYRDASNYKIGQSEIVSGVLSDKEIKSFNKKNEGKIFYPAKLGFSAETFADLGYQPYDDDPDFHEFCWLQKTEKAPTKSMDVHQFVKLFKSTLAF